MIHYFNVPLIGLHALLFQANSINTSLFYFKKWFVVLALLLVVLYLSSTVFNQKSKKNSFIYNYSEFAPKEELYNMFLLIMGNCCSR